MKNAFGLLCQQPHTDWLDFLQTFPYDCYVFIDDNSFDCSYLSNKYPQIKLIQLDDDICYQSGYHSSHSQYFYRKKKMSKRVTSVEKALYFFKKICNESYSNYWLCEDDVFIHSINNLIAVDLQYNQDFLSNTIIENDGSKSDWHWSTIDAKSRPPWYQCMVCITRISNKLLDVIDQFATKHKTFYFSEAMFPTLAIKSGLSYAEPNQFKWVLYNTIWTEFNIQPGGFYHPVKDINSHKNIRKII